MRTFLGRFLISLTACMLAAGAVLGQSEGGKLEVLCVDENGNPLKDVQVFVQQWRGEWGENKKTNKKGTAEFKKVVQGIFRVMARREGYDPALQDLYRFPGEGEHSLTLSLQPGDSAKQLYFEDEALQAKANQLITEAVNSFRASDFKAAEEKLKASLEINPSSIDAQQNLGLVYLGAHNWEEAKATLEKAEDLIGYYIDLGVDGMVQRRAQLRQAIERIPLLKIAAQTEDLMSRQRYSEAIPLFEQMQELSPDNPDLHYNMALALAHADRLDEAKAAIAKAMELRPNDVASQRLHQQILDLEESGRSIKAQETIQAIEKQYTDGNYEAALQECEKAFKSLDEKFQAPVWIIRARSYAKLGQADQAIDSYLKAVQMKPEDQNLKEELADVYIAAEKFEEGIALYSKVLEGKSEAADQAFFDMAQSFNSKGKADLAGMLFQKVLEINPDFAEAYYQLGIYYFYEKQDREQAKQMLNRYLEIGQNQNNKDNATAILTVMEKTK